MTRARNFTEHRGQSVARVLNVNYDLAFKICGPTPRVPRPEPKKRGGAPKYPDDAVREARKLHDAGMFPAGIARTLQKTYPGLPATWVRAVIDGVIRADVA